MDSWPYPSQGQVQSRIVSSHGSDGARCLHAKYLRGNCHILALALNEIAGFPIFELRDAEIHWGTPRVQANLMHFFVRQSDGMALDILGPRPFRDVAKTFNVKMGLFVERRRCDVAYQYPFRMEAY